MAPLARALRLNRRAGREEPGNVGRLGSVYWELGRLREAADHHARAYVGYQAFGSRGGEAIALANLGETHYLLGREGLRRQSSWWKGEWTDELLYAVLASEFSRSGAAS